MVLELVLELVVLEVLEVDHLMVLLVEQQILPHNHVIKEMLEDLVQVLNPVMLVVAVVEQERLVLQELHLLMLVLVEQEFVYQDVILVNLLQLLLVVVADQHMYLNLDLMDQADQVVAELETQVGLQQQEEQILVVAVVVIVDQEVVEQVVPV
jgi:hypothetical protein